MKIGASRGRNATGPGRGAARQRLPSRRAFLAAVAATFAVACSRSSGDPQGAAQTLPSARPGGPGPLGPVKRGGALRTRLRNDYINLDPHATAQASAQWIGMLAYSRLLRFAIGPEENNLIPRVVPEMTTDLGESPDGSRIIFRLRNNAYFHDVPPVYGRPVTATDVRLSFERARAGRTGASLNAIESVRTPDQRTVVLLLRRPTVTLPTLLASAHGLFIMPYEVDARFDASQTPIGAGPWMLERLEPAVQARWKANPRYFLAAGDARPVPYAEALVEKVIPEDATATAQFSAGELDILDMSSQDLFAIQSAVPEAQIKAFPQHGFSFMGFSSRPGQPFRDLRVRRAFSLALDRPALSNVSYDTDRLEQAGYPVLREQPSSPLPAKFKYWVDPDSQSWGYYYRSRPVEARQLLAAAGWDFEQTVNLNFTNNRYGRPYTDSVEAVIQLLGSIGVKVHAVGHDYASAWVDVWQRGEFDGIGYFLVARFPEPHDYFSRIVHSRGQFNPGRIRDPVLDALIEKEDITADAADREALAREIIERVNEDVLIPPLAVGTAMQYNVAQPWLGNAQRYYTTNTGAWYAEVYPHYWLNRDL